MSTIQPQYPTFWQRSWRWACGWPSDVLLWLVLVTTLVVGVVLWRQYSLSGLGPQTLVLHSADANDVKPGSNVYFLGVHVGTVEEVRFPFDELRDGVALVVHTHKHLPPMPENLGGYILFNSLAGAKEVHLVPPPDNQAKIAQAGQQGQQLIEIEEPVRLRDVMNVNVEVNNYLKMGAQTLSTVLGREGVAGGRIALLQQNVFTAQQVSQDATDVVGNTTEFIQTWGSKMETLLHTTNQQMTHVSQQLAVVQDALSDVQGSQPFKRLNDSLTRAEAAMANIDRSAEVLLENEARIDETLATIQSRLTQWQTPPPGRISPTTWRQKLQGVHHTLDAAGEKVEQFNQNGGLGAIEIPSLDFLNPNASKSAGQNKPTGKTDSPIPYKPLPPAKPTADIYLPAP